MARRAFSTALAGLTLVLLGACGPRDRAPPMLTVSALDCVSFPALANATPLPVTGKTSLAMTAATPCLSDGQGLKRLYALFQLPDANSLAYTVSVASIAQGQSVFAPQITLLNALGEPIREISSETLQFRGGSLTGLFRSRAGEQYLLVTSNPNAVGLRFSRTAQAVSSSTVAAGGGFVNVHTGMDTTTDYVFAHSGKIEVSIDPLPTKG